MTQINMAILWVCLVTILIPSGLESISVVGPKVLRPFGNYKVAVSGGPRAQTLYVAVEGRQGNGEQYSQGREVQVQPASSRIIDLDIGDPGPGQYSLIARSTSGPQFSSSARLVYQPRSFCVFIQSDKRIYQPGDTIRFRVIALDKFLLPLSGTVEISIIDAGGSPVRQWAGVELDRGIASNEFVIADEPGLGEWSIEVESRGQKYSRNIMVADYVMPKFNMEIQMPKQILFTDGRFNINITAKHFNGLPVEGELTISAYAVFFSGLLQPVFSSPARKVIDFKGQTDVIYDLKTDLDLAEDAARPLVVEAVLEEKDTLIKQNVSSRILLLRAPYRLKISAPDYFKPTLPYNVQIELVDPSGQVMDSDGDVTVERLWDDGAPMNVTTIALNKGLASYSIVPDKAHTNSTLNLLIKYKDVTERVVNVQRSDIASGQFLTVEVLTRETNEGEDMRARISATEPMDLVHYVVIARGDIIIAKTLELNPARKSVDISVPVTRNMSPGSVILAWYPRLSNDNLLPTAAVFAPHKHTYQHKVVVLTSSSTYRLNSTIELRVSGEPGAHVALTGEDTNAIAAGLAGDEGLGTGLNLHTIQREAESFNGLKHSLFKNEDDLPTMGVDLGGYSTADVFDNAGVVILTDSNIGRINNEGDDLRQIPETGTRPPLAGPYAFSRLPPPPSPRYYLTVSPKPTWLLANFTLDSDGKGVEVRRSPQASGQWKIGAFAVHPQLGLTLAEPQIFKTTVPLTITTELPPSLQRGETLAVVVTLKSSLTVDTSVEITFHNTEQFYEFEPLDNSVDAPKKIELYRRLRLTIPANGLASTAFLVSAVKSGEAPIIVEAQGNGVSASLLQTIFVNDGYEEEISSWGLLDARRGVAHGNISLSPLAGTRLSGAALLAAGDVLAPALQAARAPPAPAATPAGAVRPLARAAVLLDYLQATDRNQAALNKELREQASIGYQRLMAYRRPDGSFAPDTADETEGDVWLTSLACKWLSRGTRYVQTSPAAAAGAARWLQRRQAAGGEWPRVSAVVDPHAQAPHALAAHVSLALHEMKGNLYTNAMNKAIDYIARSLPEMKDPYTLAVASYALAVARHPQAQEVLQMMEKFANTTETSVFWSRKLSGSEWRNPWLKHNSLEASTAAFALRTMVTLRLTDQAGPVANFLLQANQLADQDPEVLDALAQYAEATRTATKLRISVNVTGSEELRQFTIEDDKSLIINTKLVRNARSAFATTEGRGMAILGLQAKGYTNVTAAWPRYILDPRVDQVSTKDRLQLSICIGFVPQGNDTESGITLMTVYLPSGYLADIHTVTELASLRHVVAARLAGGGSRVLAWLRAARAERCATLAAPRARPTARQRPGAVTLADTADNSHRARVFFSAVSASACDACRAWESCARACGAAAQQLPASDRPGAGGAGSAGGAGGAGGAGRGAAGVNRAGAVVMGLAAVVALLGR